MDRALIEEAAKKSGVVWIEPSGGRQLAPSEGRQLAPSEGRQLAPSEGRQLAPSEGRQLAPSEGRQLAPSEGRQHAPSEGRRPGVRIAWHVWHEGAIYVVTGGTEQSIPGLADGSTAEVTLPSKSTRGALGAFTAEVSVVKPGTEEWDAVIPVLAKSRLNATDGLVDGWAEHSSVVRLAPAVQDLDPTTA